MNARETKNGPIDAQESKGIVLVADDSADVLSMLNETLASEGYTVLVAMDGMQVLAIANRMMPDLILMDAIMPNMDGFEACRALKKNAELSDVPVVFMTGLSDSEHVVMGLEAGGVDYVHKPVDLNELLARVRVHLGNSRLTRSARNALDEIGQLTFACNVHGQVLWSTVGARELLDSANQQANWLTILLPQQISAWLAHNPPKHSSMSLRAVDKPLQLRFLGRLSPGEYLLRLLDDDELSTRAVLRGHFSLTEREAEVLFWLTKGKTNREIGQILSMSPRTVNKHLEQVYKKLAVENRTTAAAVCLKYINDR